MFKAIKFGLIIIILKLIKTISQNLSFLVFLSIIFNKQISL